MHSTLIAAALVACGGSTPKPPPTPEAPAAASNEPIATPAATPGATMDATDAGAAAANTPAAPAGGETIPAGTIAEGHDECAGQAAPFEEKVRAKFNECYQAGKKKNPELAGTIRVTLRIDGKGKVKIVGDPSKLDKPVVDCMVNVVKKEPFDAKQCIGKNVTVTKTYGGK